MNVLPKGFVGGNYTVVAGSIDPGDEVLVYVDGRKAIVDSNGMIIYVSGDTTKMAKYRKKPVVIEASQWFKHGEHPAVRETSYAEIAKLLGTSGCSKEPPYWSWQAMGVIDTPEGAHAVIPGDWIIKGVKGEFYPCKNDIFLATYEKVEANG